MTLRGRAVPAGRLAAALLAACGSRPLVAQSFEGIVSMNVTGDGGVRQVSYMLKGGKLRFDVGGGTVSVVLDPHARHIMMIMNAQKMYTERDFDGGLAASVQQEAVKDTSVVRTGKMETVAGHSCEHVTLQDDDGAPVDACLTSELGGFRLPAASNPAAPRKESGWLAEVGARSFPLKVTKGGKVIMVVTSIEKKALDPALFAAPAGFQEFTMPTRRPEKR